jgi:soluble lytic murein transglycosylase-like protein
VGKNRKEAKTQRPLRGFAPLRFSALPFLLLLPFSQPSLAEYIVLRNGQRLHVTGYEREGEVMRLYLPGGTVQVAAAEVAAIEPEDTFTPIPRPAPSAQSPFAELIRAAAEKHGLEEALLTAVIAAESNFDPRAVSRKGARGLMQLMPETAADYGVADSFDPAQNIDGGACYLKDLLARYDGDLRLALAAYNAGPERVERARGVPPIAETQAYVKRVSERVEKKRPARKR